MQMATKVETSSADITLAVCKQAKPMLLVHGIRSLPAYLFEKHVVHLSPLFSGNRVLMQEADESGIMEFLPQPVRHDPVVGVNLKPLFDITLHSVVCISVSLLWSCQCTSFRSALLRPFLSKHKNRVVTTCYGGP